MKIGIGITTWRRPDLFSKLLENLKNLDERFHFAFVFDGDSSSWSKYDLSQTWENFGNRYQNYKFGVNVGVARAKNKAIELLSKSDVDYYFLLDDDILIKDLSVFDYYINAHILTKLKHFMFLHIPPNKITSTIMYAEDFGITIHEHAQGAFMMFTKDHLKDIGNFDTSMVNALEHVDITFRSYTAQGLPFWSFIDVLGSEEYLEEVGGDSTITNKDKYTLNLHKSAVRWMEKYGHSVAETPRIAFTELVDRLKKIKL